MTGILSGLELLTAVTQTGSFVGAGERVGLSQSGVSRAVARLEEKVGVRLFHRNARAVTLTDEGRRFYEEVAPLVGAIEEAVQSASRARGQVRGKLRVNVDPFFAHAVLAPRIEPFLNAHPDLELEVVVRDHADHFVAEGFDVAVRFDEPREQGVVARRLLRTRIITCASPSYIARYGRPRQPRDLAHGHSCILFRDPHTGRPFDWEFWRGRRRIRVPVKGRLFVNDSATGKAACLAGQGVAQLMALGTEELRAQGALIELFPSWGDELFALYALYPSKQLPPAKVRAFVDSYASPPRDYPAPAAPDFRRRR